MKVKVFQKNIHSDKHFKEVFEKTINEWLCATPIKIIDVQFSMVPMRRTISGAYVAALCTIMYEDLDSDSPQLSYEAHVIDKVFHQTTPQERTYFLESGINDILAANQEKHVEICLIKSAGMSWTSAEEILYTLYYQACLIIFRS